MPARDGSSLERSQPVAIVSARRPSSSFSSVVARAGSTRSARRTAALVATASGSVGAAGGRPSSSARWAAWRGLRGWRPRRREGPAGRFV